MHFDHSLTFDPARTRRADLQARADMLSAATSDFARQGRHMRRLEGSLARWLIDFRQSFGDRFCTHSLMSLLPLPDVPSQDPIEQRMRHRVNLSRELRPRCFTAMAQRRYALRSMCSAHMQVAVRLHTRAFETVEQPCWAGTRDEAVEQALREIMSETLPPTLSFHAENAGAHLSVGRPT